MNKLSRSQQRLKLLDLMCAVTKRYGAVVRQATRADPAWPEDLLHEAHLLLAQHLEVNELVDELQQENAE